jgi:ketosteroid isomerase-like protein
MVAAIGAPNRAASAGEQDAATIAEEETMDNVATIRSGYEAFARGDVGAVLELLDPQIEWNVPGTLGLDTPFRGREEVAGFFGAIRDMWEELHVGVEDVAAIDESRVLALGVHHGRIGGAAVDVPFAHVWTLRDDRPVRFVEYADAAVVLQAQGRLAAASA